MGVRILHDSDDSSAVMYCSVTDWAFGPVFMAEGDETASDVASAFLKSLIKDPRTYPDSELEKAYYHWLANKEQRR